MSLFSPYIKDGDQYPGEHMQDGRALMELSDADEQAWMVARVNNRAAVITDQNTGTRWVVTRADCGLGCMCAAMAQAVVEAKV